MLPHWLEFHWGQSSITLSSYQSLQTVGAIVFVVVAMLFLRSQTTKSRSLLVAIAFLAAVYIGSRASYSLLTLIGPEREAVPGMWLPGGIITSLLLFPLLGRLSGVSSWSLADRLAPAAYFASAIMRLGCLMRGCCFGEPTTASWGIRFPRLSPAHLHQAQDDLFRLMTSPLPVHPTQIIDSLGSAIVGIVAVLAMRSPLASKPGSIAILCGLLYLANRMLVQSLRADDPRLPDWVTDSWLPTAILALGLGALALVRLTRRSHKSVEHEETRRAEPI